MKKKTLKRALTDIYEALGEVGWKLSSPTLKVPSVWVDYLEQRSTER